VGVVVEYVSPTFGRLSFEEMFRALVAFVQEEPEHSYHLIIGTDSVVADHTCFVTAIVVHRVGHGARYFYRKQYNPKITSLRQRILYEAALSLEIASRLSSVLARNGYAHLPIEIHLDVGDRGDTKSVIREVVGMVTGSGYAARTKPEAYAATKVADRHSK
jgi:predicted RNase H-related nuclease YkuK (DUF458 family)